MNIKIVKIELIVAVEADCADGTIESVINDVFGECRAGGVHLAAGMLAAQELVYLDSATTDIAEVSWMTGDAV